MITDSASFTWFWSQRLLEIMTKKPLHKIALKMKHKLHLIRRNWQDSCTKWKTFQQFNKTRDQRIAFYNRSWKLSILSTNSLLNVQHFLVCRLLKVADTKPNYSHKTWKRTYTRGFDKKRNMFLISSINVTDPLSKDCFLHLIILSILNLLSKGLRLIATVR